MFEDQIAELLAKLNGIIWKKVEIDGSLMKVYTDVIERMGQIENFEGLEGLRILGEIGG